MLGHHSFFWKYVGSLVTFRKICWVATFFRLKKNPLRPGYLFIYVHSLTRKRNFRAKRKRKTKTKISCGNLHLTEKSCVRNVIRCRNSSLIGRTHLTQSKLFSDWSRHFFSLDETKKVERQTKFSKRNFRVKRKKYWLPHENFRFVSHENFVFV